MRWALLLALAFPCAAQQKCAPKLVSHDDSTLGFTLQKGERYRRTPVIFFDVQADGRVTNVKLKRSSGVKRLDTLVLHDVGSYRFNERPGCPVVELTESINIDFY